MFLRSRMVKVTMALCLVGSVSNVTADELDGISSTPGARPDAIIVRSDALEKKVTAYRLENVDKARLQQLLALAKSGDARTKADAERELGQLWQTASRERGNLVAELVRSNDELDGVSSTPGWRSSWCGGWGWNGWGGYYGGYNWNQPYYYPGNFHYHNGGYNYGYGYYGGWGGYYGGGYGHYGIYCY